MKINSLLAGTLALVLVAGLGTPAFAESGIDIDETSTETGSISESATPSSDPIVFESGGDPDFGTNIITDQNAAADDFILDEDTFITDFHFVFQNSGGWDGTMEYFIFADNGGEPGGILVSGTAQNLDMQFLEQQDSLAWFDLEEPFLAEAGVTYWFGLHTSADFIDDGTIGWDVSTESFGNPFCFTQDLSTWICSSFDGWFELSGLSSLVGGEIIPIDSTSLILAGAQSFSWMIPLVLSGIGIGLFVVSRKSE